MIRLAAFDLDGTLLDHNLTLSPRIKAAIARAQAQGIHVTLATGRGPEPAIRFATQLNLNAPLVCFQGGLIYDYQTHTVLHETRLDPTTIPLVTQLAQLHDWNLQFETPFMIYLPRRDSYPEILMNLLRVSKWTPIDDLAFDLPEVPYKFILSAHHPDDRPALTAQLKSVLAEHNLPIHVVPSHPVLVEGLPQESNKGKGLEWLAGYYGIDRSEVLAVGDNDNDVEMLKWAGVGVAMGNGSPAALAAADWVTASVAEDGAAIALEKYLD
jgi:hypothetical protein